MLLLHLPLVRKVLTVQVLTHHVVLVLRGAIAAVRGLLSVRFVLPDMHVPTKMLVRSRVLLAVIPQSIPHPVLAVKRVISALPLLVCLANVPMVLILWIIGHIVLSVLLGMGVLILLNLPRNVIMVRHLWVDKHFVHIALLEHMQIVKGQQLAQRAHLVTPVMMLHHLP